ncbi:MAG: FAD-dependent oxidoreductase, partial [Chloroflexota bacterium]
MAEQIIVYGTYWCPDCKRAKKFLGEQQVPYEWVDIEQDDEARVRVEQLNQGKRIIPTLMFPDGSMLVEPSNAELAAKLGMQLKARSDFYDCIIVGGGVTGLTAALYLAREGVETLIIEKSGLGGQAAITEKVENYPGFPDGVSGAELTQRMVTQARRFEVEILQAQDVTAVKVMEPYRFVRTGDGTLYCAHALLIATGADYRRLNVRGEDEYIGSGIHFCATCDGPFYKGMDELLVIGGGNTAAEEGLYLTKFAKKVTLLVRGDHLNASRIAQDEVLRTPQVEVKFNTAVKEFRGNGKLSSVLTQNQKTGAVEELHPAAAFIFIGQQPNSQLVKDVVELDDHKYIITGHDLHHLLQDPATSRKERERPPFHMETSEPGIFAAGDVRKGATAQIASAVGEGASAALA